MLYALSLSVQVFSASVSLAGPCPLSLSFSKVIIQIKESSTFFKSVDLNLPDTPAAAVLFEVSPTPSVALELKTPKIKSHTL